VLICGLLLHTYTRLGLCCGWSQAGQVSAAECNNIKKVLKDDDALAIWTNEPHSTIFVQRVIAQLDQLKPAKGLSTGTPGLSSHLLPTASAGKVMRFMCISMTVGRWR